MKHYVLIVTVLTVILTGNLSRGDDSWPGWLGPDRDGRVRGFEPPKPWPDQLNRVWQVEVGTGYGSPLISGDRIYLHTRQGGKEVIRCLNRQDGTEQWKTELAVPFRASPGGEFHGPGPKATPMLSGERLFTMSITGTLSAWNATTGTRLWQKNYDAAFEKSHPNWGASTSPIAEGNRVFVHFGTDKRGALVAMDAESGEEIWKLGDDGPSYSSPLIAELDGVRQVVEWNHQALVGVDIDSGKLLWEFPFPHIRGNQNMPTPVIHEGCVLLGGEGRGIHGLYPQLKDGRWTVTDRWFQKRVPLNMSTAVINGDHLYGLSQRKLGHFFCLDPEDGTVLWEGPPRTGKNVMFLSLPGHIAALIDHGVLRIFKADPGGYKKVVDYRVAEDRTWAPPVFLPEGVLVKDHQHLTMWAFDS